MPLLDSSKSACPDIAVITSTLPLQLLILLHVDVFILHDFFPHNIGFSTGQQYTALPIADCGSPSVKAASAAGLTGI